MNIIHTLRLALRLMGMNIFPNAGSDILLACVSGIFSIGGFIVFICTDN